MLRLYNVYIYCLNGNTIRLGINGEDNTIANQVKELLEDNGGGSAEILGENGFYQIVDA